MRESKIFLGLNCKTCIGQQVSDEAFNSFLKENVDPILIGYTVLEGRGYWQGLSEASKVILALDADEAIMLEIARAYKARFSQDVVLMTEEEIQTLTI